MKFKNGNPKKIIPDTQVFAIKADLSKRDWSISFRSIWKKKLGIPDVLVNQYWSFPSGANPMGMSRRKFELDDGDQPFSAYTWPERLLQRD